MFGHQLKRTLDAAQKARRALKKRVFGYIAAGLGLVAGLAWNDAIKLLIEKFIPNPGSNIAAKLIYAVIITAVVGLLLVYVEKETEEKK